MCISTVYKFCKQHNVNSSKLLLAVSGGGDSVALIHLVVDLRERLMLSEIGVAHVNHGLRPEESDREEEFVSKLAQQNRCTFYSTKLQGKRCNDTGIEQWAREERYRFFTEVKEKFGYRFVATGHTADDQAETILMRIARGSGIAGLCGIHTVRDDGVIRPLLSLRKVQLRAWLEKKGHIWFEDPSNADQRYKRNWIRHSIIPHLKEREPKVVENLAAFADYMQAQKKFLNPLVNKWVTDHVIEEGTDRFVLNKPVNEKEYVLASEGCAQLFKKYGIPFEKGNIDGFLKEIKRKSGCFLLKGGWRFYPGKNQVEVISDAQATGHKRQVFSFHIQIPGETVCSDPGYRFSTTVQASEECNLHFNKSNWTVYLDAEKIGKELLFRRVKKEDAFQPLGYNRPVNCIRFLKNQRISSFYRQSTGVITNDDNKIVWIPGVAVAHGCRITSTTKTVFRIFCRSIS